MQRRTYSVRTDLDLDLDLDTDMDMVLVPGMDLDMDTVATGQEGTGREGRHQSKLDCHHIQAMKLSKADICRVKTT